MSRSVKCLNYYSPLAQMSILGEEDENENTVPTSPYNISCLLNVPLEDGERCHEPQIAKIQKWEIH